MIGDATEVERLGIRLALVTRWYNELHYAVRKTANILDHKLTEEEAHEQAMTTVKRLYTELEASPHKSVDSTAKGESNG